MENDDHANTEFSYNTAGDHSEFSSWVFLCMRGQWSVLSASNLALAIMMAAAFFLGRITSPWRVGPSTTRTTAHQRYLPVSLSFFTVSWGETNCMHTDFRMIPPGDIDLQHEIRLNKLEGPAVVGCRPERASVRRVYSDRIDGRNAPTTVAMYQGPGAEEVCLESVLLPKFCV
jgi:hypothetical protein